MQPAGMPGDVHGTGMPGSGTQPAGTPGTAHGTVDGRHVTSVRPTGKVLPEAGVHVPQVVGT